MKRQQIQYRITEREQHQWTQWLPLPETLTVQQKTVPFQLEFRVVELVENVTVWNNGKA